MSGISVRLNGVGKDLDISKVVEVGLSPGRKQFIYLEEMAGGRWRLSYTRETIPDIRALKSLEIIRSLGSKHE